jgi:hypothetical protein
MVWNIISQLAFKLWLQFVLKGLNPKYLFYSTTFYSSICTNSGNERSCICVFVHVYINFDSFYECSIELWSCSESVIFVLFYYHEMTYISADMLTKDSHY